MKRAISTTIILLLLPGVALAHTGLGSTAGFMHGFWHPLGGADHLLAMLAVGLWGTQLGGRAVWAVPCTFVGVMIFGGLLGFSGIGVPYVEAGIMISVLIPGVMIAGAFKFPLAYSAVLVGVFAIFHGHAHGSEMPVSVAAAFYTGGFALATAMLHLTGLSLGMLLQKTDLQKVRRIAGGAIALGGIFLAVS